MIGLLLASAIATTGCSRETPTAEGGFANDLKVTAPVARGGIPDDSIKPAPGAVAKVGTNDDSVKPRPAPVTKGGIADDGVKPRTLPIPLPTPAPR